MSDFVMIQDMPATFSMALFCTGIWLYIWNRRINYEDVGFNYDKITQQKEFWRIVTSGFSHISVIHLVFNMYSLVTLGIVELNLSSIEYLKCSFIILILSELLIFATYYVMIRFLHREEVRQVYALGYSCVVFGIMAVAAVDPNLHFSFLGIGGIPAFLTPFLSLAITQLLVPQASLVGHLSGVVVGFLYGFEVFFWVSDYLFLCLAFWTLVFFTMSIKLTTNFPLPFIRIEDDDGSVSLPAAQIINGRIVYDRNQQEGDGANNHNHNNDDIV